MAYKTFNRFLKSLSIKKKLTYTLIPVILVTYLLSVGSVYMVSFHETKSIVNQQAQTLANQRTQLVDSYLDQLRTETEIFMFDTAFQIRFRTNRSTLSLSQQEELNKEITQYMYSMIISCNVYVESITLINNHLDSYNWHMDGRNSYSAYISRFPIRSQSWTAAFCIHTISSTKASSPSPASSKTPFTAERSAFLCWISTWAF